MRQWLTQKITRKALKEFLVQHSSDKKTLDLGCSESNYAELFPNSTSLDIDETKNPDVVGDAHALPFPGEVFEVILCTEVLEHLHSPHVAVSEMHRVLQSGGTLILTTRFLYPLHDTPHDYFRFTPYGLRHLFKEWEIVSIDSETDSMGTFAVLLQTAAQRIHMRGGVVTKILFLITARLVQHLSWLSKKETTSGRAATEVVEKNIMASGYYVICRKK